MHRSERGGYQTCVTMMIAAPAAHAADDLGDAVLLSGLVHLGIFVLPFAMARLEPRQPAAHRATGRRPGSRN